VPTARAPTASCCRPGGLASASTVVVALGSNLGDRRAHLLDAARDLARLFSTFHLSSLIETAPVGAGLELDPPYLNAVAAGESSLTPAEIMDRLREIEAAHGRTRAYPGAPRTLDLDLILAGDTVIDEPRLQVPHPRFRDRLFVLEPLAEIAPDLVDPVTGMTVRELLQKKKAGA
jgi:2-amino-4-hydroxy-6-hydroxymethyldihydropteridine diphosphokinase